MVELLNNSLVSSIPLTGHNCHHHFHGSSSKFLRSCPYIGSGKITNRWCAKTFALSIMSMSEDIQTSNGVSHPGGNVGSKRRSNIKTSGVDQPLKVQENKLLFLEERDEETLSNRILRLSRSNKFKSALGLYGSMEFSGLRPNKHACNSLLSCLLRNKMLNDALKIFDFMKENDMTTGHTFSLMIKAVANARGCDAAIGMFEQWLEKSNLNKHFDVVVYNTIISACGKENNWVQAEKFWRRLKMSGQSGTSITYRLLVCIFVRCGRNELAVDAYQEMMINGLEPGEDAMHAVIGACAKEDKWDLALSVFQDMIHRGLRPNLIACNALINSLGKSGKAKLAFEVYGFFKSLGHSPDAYTLNALLGALYRANQHEDALRLFESIRKGQSSFLSLHMYNTVLMSCQRLGLWDKALQLFWDMEGSGLPVSTTSYNLVIGACEVARRPEVALQVYEHMVHQKHTPDTFTLLSLIRGCIWGSLWDEMDEILNSVEPNGSLYNAAIQGLCLRNKIDSAKKLYRKMRKIGIKPDGKTWALMLQNLRKNSIRRRKR